MSSCEVVVRDTSELYFWPGVLGGGGGGSGGGGGVVVVVGLVKVGLCCFESFGWAHGPEGKN